MGLPGHETYRIPVVDRRNRVVAYALVGEHDYVWAAGVRWTLHSKHYAASSAFGSKKLMHRLIMSRLLGRELRTEEQVHHDNESKLDNRRGNLILTTGGAHHRDYHSGYGHGFCFHAQSGKWMAYLDRPGEPRRYLGLHDTPDDAREAVAIAREEALNAIA